MLAGGVAVFGVNSCSIGDDCGAVETRSVMDEGPFHWMVVLTQVLGHFTSGKNEFLTDLNRDSTNKLPQ
jgi:hypothetical protein